ncbi:hypothetical protein GPECTOR_36g132 [Gonium pectorale]|uniref:Uncharacterized protein n=1 Tax=Gonium pectorale TaxID=33097 RepID=A0A150GBQ3_GONPE|nr:hypothetical protein GPECTOR_36g132 [Gonium pectorale]|eukprot:KXZ47281.1 hypothetical protein GPECTOR_36g132 [Gonium pectorale]
MRLQPQRSTTDGGSSTTAAESGTGNSGEPQRASVGGSSGGGASEMAAAVAAQPGQPARASSAGRPGRGLSRIPACPAPSASRDLKRECELSPGQCSATERWASEGGGGRGQAAQPSQLSTDFATAVTSVTCDNSDTATSAPRSGPATPTGGAARQAGSVNGAAGSTSTVEVSIESGSIVSAITTPYCADAGGTGEAGAGTPSPVTSPFLTPSALRRAEGGDAAPRTRHPPPAPAASLASAGSETMSLAASFSSLTSNGEIRPGAIRGIRALEQARELRAALIAEQQQEQMRLEGLAQQRRETVAAIAIQAAWRGLRARRKAAVRKQTLERQRYLERERRKREQRQREIRAAVKLQAAWRGRVARRQAEQMRAAAAAAAAAAVAAAAEQCRREVAAAITMQAAWRGARARLQLRMLRAEQTRQRAAMEAAAAIKIQAAWRGRQARGAAEALRRELVQRARSFERELRASLELDSSLGLSRRGSVEYSGSLSDRLRESEDDEPEPGMRAYLNSLVKVAAAAVSGREPPGVPQLQLLSSALEDPTPRGAWLRARLSMRLAEARLRSSSGGASLASLADSRRLEELSQDDASESPAAAENEAEAESSIAVKRPVRRRSGDRNPFGVHGQAAAESEDSAGGYSYSLASGSAGDRSSMDGPELGPRVASEDEEDGISPEVCPMPASRDPGSGVGSPESGAASSLFSFDNGPLRRTQGATSNGPGTPTWTAKPAAAAAAGSGSSGSAKSAAVRERSSAPMAKPLPSLPPFPPLPPLSASAAPSPAVQLPAKQAKPAGASAAPKAAIVAGPYPSGISLGAICHINAQL